MPKSVPKRSPRSAIVELRKFWAVGDATSTAVMRRFYEHISTGQDIAEALTRAKEGVVEPFGADALTTVAAFQLVGVGDHRMPARKAPPKTTGGQAAQ